MLKVGDTITIRYSKKLAQDGHGFLANKTAVVLSIRAVGDKISGVQAWVNSVRRNKSYYIPISSIEGPDDINRMRALSLLRSTTL